MRSVGRRNSSHEGYVVCEVHVCVLIRFHFPRITTHLLRVLRPDERRRQIVDFRKLHGLCAVAGS